jgi:tetratricopeptide (TPR) repeat protein
MNAATPLLAVLLLAGAAMSGCARDADVVAPAAPDACVIALAPSAGHDDADWQIATLQEQVRRRGDATQALERLGYRYIARARARHDAGDYLLAQKTADCLLSKDPGDEAGLLLSGHALHQLHRFAEAEVIARRLVRARGLALDYGLLGDALMEQGRLSEAAVAYQRMIDLKPFYQSYTRGAHLRWLTGDLDGAIELMRLAIPAASARDADSIAWAYTRLADYELQRGRVGPASSALDTALAHRPDYAAALLARGRILLAQRRPGDASRALERATQLNPLPEYRWALADVLRLVGRTDAAVDVERALELEGSRSDPRTLALFLATRKRNAAEAVALAHREMASRADVFTLDAVAWSLVAAGRFQEAEPFMTRALAEGTRDGRLFLHAAAIAAATGRRAEARRWLDRAEGLRVMLLPSELDELAAVRATIARQEENQS